MNTQASEVCKNANDTSCTQLLLDYLYKFSLDRQALCLFAVNCVRVYSVRFSKFAYL